MAALPYIQLYVADYLADTVHLTTEQHGAYLMIIFNYWQTGKPIPESRLPGITKLSPDRWSEIRDLMSEFFSVEEGKWTHLRIEADLETVNAQQTQRSRAGRASAKKRQLQAIENEKEINGRSTGVQRSMNDTDTDTEQIHIKEKNIIKKKRNVDSKKSERKQGAIEVLNFLNERCLKNFQPTEANLNFIISRLAEGATVSECRKVIAIKRRQWIDDPQMNKYLRPATLFNKTKYHQYTGEIGNVKN